VVMALSWVALSLITTWIPATSESGFAGLVIYVGFLVLGRVIYLGYARITSIWLAIVLGAAVLAAFLAMTEASYPGFLLAPGGWVGYEPIVTYGYALVIFIGLMLLAPKRTVQPFTLLGDVSYSLYLLHLPVGITVLNLLDRLGVPESVNVAIAIVVAIGVSWVSWRFVELPFQRLARRWLRRGRVAETPPDAQIPPINQTIA
jgi:peptidoglycan/LPS O-acetylase OafA/YrhL